MTELKAITQETIQDQIFNIRGKQVIMDRDLAVLYGVETKVLNQAVKRNSERFPDDFMFQLTELELKNWKSHFVTSNKEIMGLRKLPFAFDEQGISMLASVLRSQTAVRVSIQIIRVFVAMRKLLKENADVCVRLDYLERKQIKTDESFDKIFNALESGDLKRKQGIFYEGQVFDAYTFVADLIRSAKHSIVLIDNYIDDRILSLFTKRGKGVSLCIYTKVISKQMALDLNKHNAQYDRVSIKEFKNAHDRFLIIDKVTVYHIGASLKDLGNKWFAFSKMEMKASDILSRLI